MSFLPIWRWLLDNAQTDDTVMMPPFVQDELFLVQSSQLRLIRSTLELHRSQLVLVDSSLLLTDALVGVTRGNDRWHRC